MILLAGVWYTASLQAEKDETGAAAAGPSPGAPAAGTDSRMLTDETRNDLIAALSEAPGKQVWFVTQANDPEADSFQLKIEDAFLQSGWKIAASPEHTRPLRAGLRVYVADAEIPDHVSLAVNGLRDIGFDVFVGTGYRAFYDRQKEKNPDFSGIELAPDQDFVVVVGPNPPAPGAAAASPSPGAPAAGTDPRMLTDETRNDLIAALSEAPGKQVWFVTQANDPEADSFQLEIEDAFLQSGWKIAASSEHTRPLRAGLRVYVADAEISDHVSVAVNGLRDIGFDVFVGTGYRAFYNRQKEKNPDFAGVELAPDQDFVIVVGPNPPAPVAAAASPSPAPSPAAPVAGTSPRMLTNETLDDLIAALSEASGNKVWFVTQANDPEANSFQLEIDDAFLQAGWKVAASSQSTRPLRAGLRVYAADAELPDHVSVAVNGLRDIGFDVFAGTGYRAFYDRQKEKNPDFSGIELAPDQDFVIVVGPNPPPP
jgi:hypothetical protein